MMTKIENEKEMNNFMYNIVWLRKNCGLSKKKMAELLCIGIGSLNKLESGRIPPKLNVEVLFQVWEHFNVHPSEMFKHKLQ